VHDEIRSLHNGHAARSPQARRCLLDASLDIVNRPACLRQAGPFTQNDHRKTVDVELKPRPELAFSVRDACLRQTATGG
jgi:hypothetical protein